jgi:hypothetical protein
MERRWTRRRTVIIEPLRDDWVVRCDGWTVGRVMLTQGGPQDGRWHCAVQTLPGRACYADTLEEALEVIRQGTSFGEDGRPNCVDVLKERTAHSRTFPDR